ncbi:2-phosphosulfolactate phosphatase [Bacillus sp. BGMRC 2118]|nr:2-phosphosulfolactate phosphatase [Bacillus sp. BGMRC 2118]
MPWIVEKEYNVKEEVKIHLLMKKEDIKEELLSSGKICVVFDLLLATTTITAALHFGAKAVIPVMDEETAKKEAENRSDCVLVGEFEGRTINGFLDPNPVGLRNKVENKTVILSTTNGTVAIHKSMKANKVYACSLLNGEKVAEKVLLDRTDETIVLVCSGSSGQFCLEDFYGAGYFIESLVKQQESIQLTDAARAAHLFYKAYEDNAINTLMYSKVVEMLDVKGYREVIDFVSQKGVYSVVPILQNTELKKA